MLPNFPYQLTALCYRCGKYQASRKLLIRVFSLKSESRSRGLSRFPSTKKWPTFWLATFLLVRETGLEPVHQRYTPLKRARLPIPPLPHTNGIITHNSNFVKRFFHFYFNFAYFFIQLHSALNLLAKIKKLSKVR